MERLDAGLPGCFLFKAKVLRDARGCFVKTFHVDTFHSLGLETVFAEEYFSVSRRNVLRGMHFQVPPHDHVKVIYCLQGRALDVILDLRRGSPTYGRCASFVLSDDGGEIAYLVPGIAHGFLALDEDVIMQYKTTSTYSSAHDRGILWSSIDFDWPNVEPVISPRDAGFEPLDAFDTPFVFREADL